MLRYNIRSLTCAILLTAAGACANQRGVAPSPRAADAAVAGTLTYRERVVLRPDASAEVSLVDATARDGSVRVIASTVVRAEGRQVPLPFSLPYDARRIDGTHLYMIRAAIGGSGETLFATDVASPVITQGNPTHVDLVLSRVDPTSSSAPERLAGSSWVLQDLVGDRVVADTRVTLDFDASGKVTGNGSCNRYFATVDISGETIRFGAVGATRMACATAVSLQEIRYFEALEAANRFEIEGNSLSIYGSARRPLRFSRASP
ncbi:MAG: YbaY family lipoprotein [Gemmatimonadota bacterium]